MQLTEKQYSLLKPGFHLAPAKYWINDPNGPIYWNGKYHMFFQHNPGHSLWGNIHWGHAVSSDMASWEILEPALQPGPEKYDREGVFSGSAILKDEVLHLFYTASAPQTQCVARWIDDDQGGHFEKYEGNPIISTPPEGFDTPDFRDPFVWKEDDGYRMLVASGFKGDGIIFIYRSQDLLDWKYVGEFYRDKVPEGYPAYECPLFLRVDGKDVLIISPYETPFYLTGSVKNEKFYSEVRGFIDPNPHWYAPNTFPTPDGRQVIIAWIKEEWPDKYQEEAGWSGALSIPRELFLLPKGRIGIKPIREMTTLRDSSRELHPAPVVKGKPFELPHAGNTGEIELILSADDSSVFELHLFEESSVARFYSVRVKSNTVVLEDRLQGEESEIRSETKSGEFEKKRNEIHMRVFMDNSIIEVFVNDSLGISTRAYPTSENNNEASLHLLNGNLEVKKCTLFQLKQDAIIS